MSLPSRAAVATFGVAALAAFGTLIGAPVLAASPEATLFALRNNQFVTYTPGDGWDPQDDVSPEQLTAELTLLRATGLDGVITYSMTNGLDMVPHVAKSVGFAYVIVGLENPAADWNLIDATNLPLIDGILVGNEGICRGLGVCGSGTPNWTLSQLRAWIIAARQDWPGKLVLTSEIWNLYHPQSPSYQADLLTSEAGDLVFPNMLPAWDQSAHVEFCPQVGVEFIQNVTADIDDQTALPIVLHEAWWPSEPTGNTCGGLVGCPGAPNGYSQAAQSRFFALLEDSAVSFVWGEAFDQPWKVEGNNAACGAALGPHWGLWKNDHTPKLVAAVVDRTVFRDGFESGTMSSWSAAVP